MDNLKSNDELIKEILSPDEQTELYDKVEKEERIGYENDRHAL